ncbi:hypothetical protein CcaverHIS002_0105520 [Cutaneotrichosporon cavernicola]|uniref:Uncharacterized protein n=1 Tax=Cutaneotrichosporon cavernicola TaxID=279322 RepID=A0AA48IHY7_9TREE|nr:uncharacterized protein CcaverHIS019_0105460 [Cutaneotrichosporon cavernicola]BEI80023.1 hypothetical protein CcaverHIS002_0105520 [Cutaneotrichosporon cavernicola]BEI87828.1 hypothetical protein CcaverHIS019_0105460 [Cutaneotrichosporon cavernicola]BEI95602.1 hypothetical protein CcaverHIS631_0105510 [Cutaneotrichosporon cavernicola]BEJ03376.1 hypothetical protein CcaverHIS641_0105510 [Cutaneotrichosporon cavernicola]
MLISVAILAAAAVTLAAPANLRAVAEARNDPVEASLPLPIPEKRYPAPLLPEGEICNTKRSPCARDYCYRCCDDGKHACLAPGSLCYKDTRGVYMCFDYKTAVQWI